MVSSLEAAQTALYRKLELCDQKQQALFRRLYPDCIEWEDLRSAEALVDRTLELNKRRLKSSEEVNHE